MIALPPPVLEAALESAELTQQYESSKHAIELLARDEDKRRLHAEILILEQDVVELHDQLQHEQDTSDGFRSAIDEHLVRAQTAEATLAALQRDHQTQQHEVSRLQQELASLRNTSQETSDLLTEKLSLSHELSLLRPEVQHLRKQAASVEGLVSEKLTLQRQLSEVQCELASAKTEAKRAQAKRRNTTMELAQEEQLEDLKRQLAGEKRARKRAEEAVQQDVSVDDVRRHLVKEKQQREKLEEEVESMRENTQVEEMRRDLLKAKKSAQRYQDQADALRTELESLRAVPPSSGQDPTAELRAELCKLQADAVTAEAETARKEDEWDAEKSTLEDKLTQFRSKLRETKELLKTTREELHIATERAEKAERDAQMAAMEAAVLQEPVVKTTTKKRAVKVADPVADETALGTPGDGPPAKRARKANAAIGSKSAFSITPYLNKTTDVSEEQAGESEPEHSPTKPRTKLPLADAESIRRNSMLSPAKTQSTAETKPAAAPVAAEQQDAPGEEVNKLASTKQKTKSKKPRKSLTDFDSFKKTKEQPVLKQKKRKLGGPGPTLFDEDDGQALSTKSSFANRSLFRGTPGSRLTSVKKSGSRTALLTANDGSGFQFSPLRRNRTNIDETLKL